MIYYVLFLRQKFNTRKNISRARIFSLEFTAQYIKVNLITVHVFKPILVVEFSKQTAAYQQVELA
jgi:hypothetical protein